MTTSKFRIELDIKWEISEINISSPCLSSLLSFFLLLFPHSLLFIFGIIFIWIHGPIMIFPGHFFGFSIVLLFFVELIEEHLFNNLGMFVF